MKLRLPPFVIGAAIALVMLISLLPLAGCTNAQGIGNNSLGAQALQNLSPFEKRVLKDKHVTQAEFDESMQVYTECLAAAGLKYEIVPGEIGMGSILVHHTGAPPGNSGNDSGDGGQQCIDQVSAVQNVWVLQNHVSAADLDKMQNKFISCLRSAGLSIKDGAGFTGAENAISQFMDSLPENYDNNSPEGIIAGKADTCRQDYQSGSGAQPLPGLQEALDNLDTSGW